MSITTIHLIPRWISVMMCKQSERRKCNEINAVLSTLPFFTHTYSLLIIYVCTFLLTLDLFGLENFEIKWNVMVDCRCGGRVEVFVVWTMKSIFYEKEQNFHADGQWDSKILYFGGVYQASVYLVVFCLLHKLCYNPLCYKISICSVIQTPLL